MTWGSGGSSASARASASLRGTSDRKMILNACFSAVTVSGEKRFRRSPTRFSPYSAYPRCGRDTTAVT